MFRIKAFKWRGIYVGDPRARLSKLTTARVANKAISATNQVELALGGVTAQLIHVGGDYATDSVIVYVPTTGWSF